MEQLYEHYYEHFMNTFMNTFLREMNTMNTLRIYNSIRILKKVTTLSITSMCIVVKSSLCSLTERNCSYNCSLSVHKNVHFGGFLNECF